jgi:hypothetical protein
MATDPISFPRVFVTPLRGRDLLDPGQVFPREELLRRVLSLFWRNCCGASGLARAPAPVVEFAAGSTGTTGKRVRARAWWVLYDGIIEEREGPDAERLALFYGAKGEAGYLWPRYEFQVIEQPLTLEMSFDQDVGVRWTSRVALESLPGGQLRVIGRASVHEP